MNRKIGIWKKSESPYSSCIKLADFKYKKGESVTLENICNFSVNITGWKIKNSEGKSYTFPKIVLKPQRNVTLYSDFGVNKGSILYLNKTDFWMDYGDILILRDSRDNLILAYRYS
jgi:hypothetical protein